MLTATQKKLAEDNEKLIWYTLYKYNYRPARDWYGIAAIGLCKAAQAYNPAKSTFAYAAVMRIRAECHREAERRNLQRHFTAASLDAPLMSQSDNDVRTLGDIVPFYADFDGAENRTIVCRMLHSLPDGRDKNIFTKWLSGYRKSELAAEYGLSRQRIGQIISDCCQRCKRSISTARPESGEQ